MNPSLRSVLATALALVSCAAPDPNNSEAAVAARKRVGYEAAAVWGRSFNHSSRYGASLASMGAGHGIVSVIFWDPCHSVQLVLARQSSAGPWPTAAGPMGPLCPSALEPMSRGYTVVGEVHSDVVYAAPGGRAWHLGAQSRTVRAPLPEDVVAVLPGRGPVPTACSSDGRVIVYTDLARPGQLQLHDITHPGSAHSVPLPAEFAGEAIPEWGRAELGGAPGGPCVFVAPWSRHFAIVLPDSGVRVARLKEPPEEPAPPAPWYSVRRWLDGPVPPRRPAAVDVTSWPGGIAVLNQGVTTLANRLVDLYELSGAYRETIILPMPAGRIAASAGQLLVAYHDAGQWRMAAFWLPGTPAPDPGSDQIEAQPIRARPRTP